jgi:hypothetical protein
LAGLSCGEENGRSEDEEGGRDGQVDVGRPQGGQGGCLRRGQRTGKEDDRDKGEEDVHAGQANIGRPTLSG